MTKITFGKALNLSLTLLMTLAACNLSRSTGSPTVVPSVPAMPAGFAVMITSPAADAQLPSDAPVQVAFSASGGPFLEFDLLVDGNNVASSAVTSTDAQVRASLAWSAPTDGAHTLTVAVLDQNKNQATADVQVTIGKGQAAGGSTVAATNPPSTSGLQLRFVNLTEGGSVAAKMVTPETGGAARPEVIVQVEATGGAALEITLKANGMLALDPAGRLTDAQNLQGTTPFTGVFHWSPLNGAGQYTLVAAGVDENKQAVEQTIHVTVTGIPAFTPTPPPLDQAQARLRFAQLYKQLYGVDIPAASMQRFSSAEMPSRSRWISSVYYKGQRYYIELFDDAHYELSPAEYADPAHPNLTTRFVLCKPAGQYKILVVYVDYGNLTVDKADVLAQVPVFANWTDQLYDDFAKSQGFSASPLHIQAEAAWIASPPSPGSLLTAGQISSATGLDPAKYNFVIEIDLDKNNTVGKSQWKGILEQGGGIALQGCGAYYDGNVNIWSIVQQTEQTQSYVHGTLSMDFNHELSHLFGMMDSWVFKASAITSPDGQLHDDWIPYTMFGWTDSDGDGIPEIIDPTPYGTAGPQP